MRYRSFLCLLLLGLVACEEPTVPPTITPPEPPPPPPLPIVFASAGVAHSCALTAAGAPYCWGLGLSGQLGADSVRNSLLPVAVRADGLVFSQIAVGFEHTCAGTTDGRVFCWGSNERGQLGTDDYVTRTRPARIGLPTLLVQQVASGGYHNCVVRIDRRVLCWGWNAYGQLGNATTIDLRLPVEIVGNHEFTTVSTGALHTCALNARGAAFCWGNNAFGQLGDGSTQNRLQAVAVAGNLVFGKISAGENHTCALTPAGEAYCWGEGRAGQLGTAAAASATQPVPVVGSTFSDISAGSEHSCGVSRAGDLLCWGNNTNARVGQFGLSTIYPTPTRVQLDSAATGQQFASVRAGRLHSCALTTAQHLYCWGFGAYGQLGNGSVLTRPTPARVTILPPAS